MSTYYSCDDITPVVAPNAYVHPSAVVIGDVIIEAGCYVGPCAVLRGDFGRIILEDGSNVQETCVVHSFPNFEVVIGADGHIGHGAILHGCTIGKNALVGMNAVVMDEAEIGENAIVAATAFVKAGTRIPPNTLAIGAPAKVVRELTDAELDWKRRGTGIYKRLALEARVKLKPVEPLSSVEANRPRVRAPDYDPLILERLKL